MAKKTFCQNVRNPRVLSSAERELYGWVDAEVFTQSSVITAEHLPELRHEMRLTQDLASERDYVLEALPFTEFQREVLTWCRVAASQLHLNGWGFLRTFERICFPLVFARLGVSFCIFTNCTLHPEMGFCLFELIKGDYNTLDTSTSGSC
ncbi:hypothetical protein PIB30_067012 [Stylosanthes scabra]|uniref:Uncharacterized protein n=1 Tax=Stylosanthes scabra TaxID=79078 RepID=A0ABU6WNI4_9FABA|nr:hypothetical protein [Stylosanthes scabra]